MPKKFENKYHPSIHLTCTGNIDIYSEIVIKFESKYSCVTRFRTPAYSNILTVSWCLHFIDVIIIMYTECGCIMVICLNISILLLSHYYFLLHHILLPTKVFVYYLVWVFGILFCMSSHS